LNGLGAKMKHFSAKKYLSWCYGMLLLLGCGITGWLLAAFQVPYLVVLISLAVMSHLIVVGVDAIALANVWVVVIMFTAAVVKAWPAIWDSRVPIENAQLWAGVLLLLWLGAIALVILLAFAGQFIHFHRFIKSQISKGTVTLTCMSVVLGYLIYHLPFVR